jgi:hypothetical protein
VGSVLMTLSVTLERFFAVVYPLKRIRLKAVLITASVVGSILYNIPRFFELKTVDIFDSQYNATVSRLFCYKHPRRFIAMPFLIHQNFLDGVFENY